MTSRDAAKLRNLAQSVLIAAGLLRQEAHDMQECATRHLQVAEILERIETELLELANGVQVQADLDEHE